jgi:hypothetical protein
MVNNLIISAYAVPLPEEGRSLKISGGPLYDLALIQRVAGGPHAVRFWTRRCEIDAASLAVDVEDVAGWLQKLNADDYRDSEWCANGTGAWAACDAYVLRRNEWIAASRKSMDVEYFLKFALAKTGVLVLMVSCHLSS